MTTPIFTNPQSQSQVRRVLQDINVCFADFDTAIAGVGTDTGTGAVSVNDGQFVRYDGSNNYVLAQADSLANAATIGAKQSEASSVIRIAQSDVVTRSGWGLTPGARYFLSASTAGEVVTVPDSTSAGAVALVVGYALSATELYVEIGTPIVY